MPDVGCAGIVVDDTFCGPMQILPAEGQLLAIDKMSSEVGGCAANVAVDLVKQGFSVDLVACSGKDASSDFIRNNLEAKGVNCDGLIKIPGCQTSKTVILLVEGQDRRYVHVFGANGSFKVAHIDRAWLAGLKVFYLGGLCAMPAINFGELQDLLKYCRQHGVITVLDVVVPQNFAQTDPLKNLLPYVDYFLPNDDEAAMLTKKNEPLEQLRILREWGAANVIVTCGKAGAVAASGDVFWRSGVYKEIDIVDPSGSGDAFAAGAIAGILENADMPSILRYGSALGASATFAIGTTGGVFTKVQAKEFINVNCLEITIGEL